MSVTVQQHVDILYVDTDPEVTERTATNLEEGDDGFTVETATSAAEGLERITDRPPDCVVSGHDISGIDGLEFLRNVREEYPELPFILFPDDGSEAVPSDALSAGATDYLRKQSATDRGTLLVTRIQNAVAQSQVEQRLREIQTEHAAVFENAQNGLLLVDVEEDGFRYQRCNPRAVELIGRDESQIVGNTPKEALGPENGQKVIGAYRKCIEQCEPVEYVLTLDLPTGEVIRQCQASPVRSNGDVDQLVVAFHDITERRNREAELEAEQQFVQQSLDTLEDVFYVLDTDGRLQQWNEKVEEMTGYSESALTEMPALEFFPEDEHTAISNAIERILSAGTATVEADVLTAAGERVPHEFRGKRLTDTDGNTTGIVGIGRDVTERKERERQLRQERRRYTTLFETLPNPVLHARAEDGEPVAKRVNPAFEDTFGYDAETICDEPLQDYILPDDQADAVDQLNKQVLTGDDVQRAVQRETTDGIRTFSLTISTRNTETETVEGYAVYTDITERKEREQERERKYKAIFNQTYQFTGLLEPDGTLIEANETALEFGGLDEEDVVGKPFWNADWWQVDDETQRELREAIDRAADGEFVRYDVEVQGEAENITIDFSIRPVTNDDGEVTYLIPEGRNITDLRTLQEQKQELERQNDLFAKSQDIANVGAWEFNLHGKDNHFTDMVYEIYGVGPDYEFESEKDIQEFYHPGDRDTVRTAVEEAVQSGKEYDLEVRITAADGTDKWVRTRGTPQVEDGTVQCVRGTIQDITEQKEREQKLENLKTQYQTLVESFPDGAVFLYDADHQVVRTGGAELSAVGLSPAELEGTVPQDRYPPEIAAELVENIDAALEGEKNTFHQTYQGEHYQIQMVPVRTDEGQITHCMAVSRNVTERREREKELRRKTRAIEEAPVGITITDPTRDDNPMIYINEMFCSVTGYSKEEALGRNCRFLQGEETSSARVEPLRSGVKKREPASTELVNYRKDGTSFWNRVDIAPVYDDAGELVNFVGFQQDVTARKEREQALQKRERTLRELHAATREFYPPHSETAVAEFLVEFVTNTFDFEYVSVKLYDDQSGSLQPAARSVPMAEATEIGEISPGPNPVWEAYRQGVPQIVESDPVGDSIDLLDSSATQFLAAPIGDFGVLLACTTGDRQFDDVDMDLIEIVTANADSSFQRLQSESVRTELVEELSLQQTKAEELRTLVETIQTIQRRLANSETGEALETSVCEELLETDRVDFAWIGRPRGRDSQLDPSTWAGEGTAYLDSVEPSSETSLVPAQRAADARESCSHPDIPSLVVDEHWAKQALSFDFKSVLSVPLVYDDVVYGVLTAYSHDEDAFDTVYESLLRDVASLLVNYGRILDQRYDENSQAYAELEFELTDTAYPLQHIATETQSTVRFEAVVENSTDELRILVTAVDGDVEQLLSAARQSNSVVGAEQFGSPTQSQLTLTVQKPFLASTVGKHNGELVQATSDAAGTTFQVLVPRDAPNRPLLDALLSTYRNIELVAQRQTDDSRVLEPDHVADILTDRQYEILNAAYHGGYYDTPRQVTGEDLAENFGISGSAIHRHLQSAHRTLLDQVL